MTLRKMTGGMVALIALVVSEGGARGDEGKVRFNRDIRPILSDKCFFCHGFDDKERKARVRLDTREGATAVKDGVVPIMPGDPSQSELMARVLLPKADEDRMPPPDSHKEALTPGEVGLIRKWIEEGAVYEKHWAFTEVVRPELPGAGEGWVRERVDRFLAARHAEEGLEPSKEAEVRTLVRRVYFDLIGLPPTPEEVDRVADGELDYESLVDELLASPRFGERMGVFWLDLVRYADTVGLHGDQEVQISPYRDYVIRAFNRNLPFDQFTVEQLAGDLLEDPSPVQLAAYRQNSYPRPDLVERDPFNRLVARQSSWRLPAEMVRDNLLEVAGLLVHKLGGPSARPLQPEGYYAHLNFPQRKYVADKGEGLHRRGIYTHWQRMFVHPAMLAFDAPTREECIAERPVSNTPLAALVLLNDPSYLEAARAFTEGAAAAVPDGGEERVVWMFRRALSRVPTGAELGIALGLVEEGGGWMALGRAILNLHETITRM